MRKIILISLVLLFSMPSYAQTTEVLKKAVSKSVNKNVKGGFYGRSTLDSMNEETPIKNNIKSSQSYESIKVEETTTGIPLDMNLIKRNQEREKYMANGLFFMRKEFYEKALEEFNKAKNIHDSEFVNRWIKVASSKIEAMRVNKIIEDLKSEINDLKSITSQK